MILSKANVIRTFNYFKKNGFKDTVYATAERMISAKKNHYNYSEPSEEELAKQSTDKLLYNPLISIIVPAYETKPIYIEDLVLSLEEQTYFNYELIIADASESPHVERMVKSLQEQYDNIMYKRLETNGGISENSNRAIELASGEYVALLDHDDLLTKDALYYMVKELNKAKADNILPELIYSDEDKTNSYLESYFEPNVKPAFNYDMILTNNYICHLSLFKATLIKELKFRKEYDGAQDYDLVLRTVKYVIDKYGEAALTSRIKHVPRILYHWRCHQDSTAANPQSKIYAYEAGKRALEDFLISRGINAKVSHIKHLGFYRVDYEKGPLSLNSIAAVGGPIYKKNKIISGAINGKSKPIYEKLNLHFSGYLNRAKLQQTVSAVDLRNIVIKDEYKNLFKEISGYSYPIKKEDLGEKYFDDEYFIKKSLIFCNKIKKNSIRIMYEPEMELHLDNKAGKR